MTGSSTGRTRILLLNSDRQLARLRLAAAHLGALFFFARFLWAVVAAVLFNSLNHSASRRW
jgi:hypothetical protein